jgi:hypothetical protein
MVYSALDLEMARRSLGYGRWDAPFWFIGPEQGKGKAEAETNSHRVEAWSQLGKPELCDCLEFHKLIQDRNWHAPTPALQSTWRALMVLLMSFLDRPSDLENLRAYQRDHWGRIATGETCVIELSGIAARNLSVLVDRTQFRRERIETIRARMLSNHPTFVVMYGLRDRASWEELSGCRLICDDIAKSGSTMIALAPHPQSHGRRNDDWIELGKKLRSKLS